MGEFKSRRSSRVALQIPIRIFGIDYRGVVFTEEAFTAVVSLHGAKVRMTHQLLPGGGNSRVVPFHRTRCGVSRRITSGKCRSAVYLLGHGEPGTET